MASSEPAVRDRDGSSLGQVSDSSARRVEFGSDGIRGVANQWPLVPPVLVRIGSALGHYLHRRTPRPQVVIGRDTRLSGEPILNYLIAGLTDAGIQTIDLGTMTTPGVAFLVREQGVDLGIVVSASHNPYDHNGIKLIGPNGLRLQREEELEIEQLIRNTLANGIPPLADVGQASNGRHLLEVYTQDHVRFLQSYWKDSTPLRSLKLVLDCANGAALTVAPTAFRMLGAEIVEVNSNPSGENINHRCGSEHLRRHPDSLHALVRAERAQYGFAFDGDGDRLAVIDNDKGYVYDGSSLLFILSTFFQERQELRYNTVVTTQLTNRGVLEALKGMSIDAILVARGDRNIEAAIWGGDYLLGGEEGGNIIINDGRHTAADAVFTALTLSGAIVKWRSLAACVAGLTLYPQLHKSITIGRQLALDERRYLQTAITDVQAALDFAGRVLWWQATTEPGVLRLLVEGAAAGSQLDLKPVFQSVVDTVQSLPFLADMSRGAAIARALESRRTGPLVDTRRAPGSENIPPAQLYVDPITGVVRLGTHDITAKLTPLLHRILLYLWQQGDRPARKDDLIGFAWREVDVAEGVTDQTVSQAVSRLARLLRKLSDGVRYVESIRGLGAWRLYPSGLPSAAQPGKSEEGSADE